MSTIVTCRFQDREHATAANRRLIEAGYTVDRRRRRHRRRHLLDILVGFVTASQVTNELDSLVKAGTVLVSVTSDAAHSPDLSGLMVRHGGGAMVSSVTTFIAGALASEPQ
jgi:hypothetical protein